MPTFILVTKLSSGSMDQLKHRDELGHEWREKVKKNCPGVKFIGHYALLGKYDFLDIFEAKDEEEAAKVSWISTANGAFWAESWTAIPYNRFIEITKGLKA